MHQLDSQLLANRLPDFQSTPGEDPEVKPRGEHDGMGTKTEPVGESSEQPLQGEQLPQRQQQCEELSVGQVANVECAPANLEMLRAWRDQNPDMWPGEHKDDDYDAWLLAAATNGDAAAVQALLNAGAYVDCADFFDASLQGVTPLYAASQHNHEAVVKMLLRAGAIVDNITGFDGSTPLHAAVVNGNEVVVRALLDAGAELNKRYFEFYKEKILYYKNFCK